MSEIKIQLLDKKAKIPNKTYNSDFCYDVVAISEEEIAPNVWKYRLGFKYEIILDDNYKDMNVALSFRPRSSIWKTGMVLSNSIGTLDEMYRGEVCAIFYHVLPNMLRYKVGDKIGQIHLDLALPISFKKVDCIDNNTERKDNGFGSTGK